MAYGFRAWDPLSADPFVGTPMQLCLYFNILLKLVNPSINIGVLYL